MGTTTTVTATAVNTNAVERFIDKIEAVLVKAEAVNAIVGAQQMAQASLAAGVNLNGAQRAALALQAATPALIAILTSKGVNTNLEATIASWIQTVFNVLAGPVAVRAAGPAQG